MIIPTSGGRQGALIALLASAALGACQTKDRATSAADTTAASASGTMAGRSPNVDTLQGNMVSRKGWTDGQILAYATAANRGEIEEGRLAVRKAANPAVKAFAHQMVADHQAMLKEGNAFASANSITPDSTKDDVRDLMKDSRALVSDLTAKTNGKDWDEAYLNHEIDAHKQVLATLQDAEKATMSAPLKAMLNKAVGKVQSHLTRAQDIKDNQLQS